MKKTKRFLAMLLASLMVIGMLPTSIFAAEPVPVPVESGKVVYEQEFEITPEMIQLGIMPMAYIDQTFYMTTSHRGANRTYQEHYLRYIITISGPNGEHINNIVAVQFCDTTSGGPLREDQFWADNSTSVRQDIPITPGVTYYFNYLLAYGTPTTLKIHMRIETYNL